MKIGSLVIPAREIIYVMLRALMFDTIGAQKTFMRTEEERNLRLRWEISDLLEFGLIKSIVASSSEVRHWIWIFVSLNIAD
jgi:hypothetical protein